MSFNSINTSKTMNIRNSHIQKNRGFTLIEALIGFLVLSIGMLGIASLQAISLKAGKTSAYGSVAMMKVEELFESMRANPSPAALAAYAAAGAGVDHGCTGVKNCTDAELAEDDVFWWSQNLTAGLPDTTATAVSIIANAVPPSRLVTVMIRLRWEERDKDAMGSVTKGYTATTHICTGVPC